MQASECPAQGRYRLWTTSRGERWAMPQSVPACSVQVGKCSSGQPRACDGPQLSNVAGGAKPSEILRENVGIQFLPLRHYFDLIGNLRAIFDPKPVTKADAPGVGDAGLHLQRRQGWAKSSALTQDSPIAAQQRSGRQWPVRLSTMPLYHSNIKSQSLAEHTHRLLVMTLSVRLSVAGHGCASFFQNGSPAMGRQAQPQHA
jgi:hypothetical protein